MTADHTRSAPSGCRITETAMYTNIQGCRVYLHLFLKCRYSCQYNSLGNGRNDSMDVLISATSNKDSIPDINQLILTINIEKVFMFFVSNYC